MGDTVKINIPYRNEARRNLIYYIPCIDLLEYNLIPQVKVVGIVLDKYPKDKIEDELFFIINIIDIGIDSVFMINKEIVPGMHVDFDVYSFGKEINLEN